MPTLAAIGLALAGCMPAPGSSEPSAISFDTLDAASLEFPDSYRRWNDDLRTLQPAGLTWSPEVLGAVSAAPCGPEAAWVWSDIEPGNQIGDPTIRLYVCDLGSPSQASANMSDDPIEASVVPQVPGLKAVDVPTPSLAAETARQACVWGTPDECRSWSFAASYGRYVVRSHWIAAASGGALTQAAFDALVVSIDRFASDALLDPR